MEKVTASSIRKLPEGLHWFDADGLGMRVGKSRRSWVHQKNGGRRTTIGQWPEMSVRDAKREVARINSEPRPVMMETTLQDAFNDWKRDVRNREGSENTIVTRELWLGKHVPADWMAQPLEKVITQQSLRRLHLEIGEKGTPSAANNVLQSLRAIWNIASDQPWPGRKIRMYREERRETIITDFAEWERCRQSFSNPHIREFWLFVLLTGLRRNDAQTARYENVRDGWLHLPTPKGGARRAFDLPLSGQALNLIDRLPRLGPWIFPGRDPKRPLAHPMPKVMPVSVHDCRRTMATVAEEIGCPRGVLARLLNHRPDRSITARYVVPTDEACQEWAERIAERIMVLIHEK